MSRICLSLPEGAFSGGGQFGLIEIIDTGGATIEVRLTGLDWAGVTKVEYTYTGGCAMTTIRRHTRFLTFLDGSGHAVAEVGYKAARLDLLIGGGCRVPTAAALTTAVYLDSLQEQRLHLLVADLKTSGLPDPAHRADERAAIKRTFASAPLRSGPLPLEGKGRPQGRPGRAVERQDTSMGDRMSESAATPSRRRAWSTRCAAQSWNEDG